MRIDMGRIAESPSNGNEMENRQVLENKFVIPVIVCCVIVYYHHM
jgi:hypothetical protein